MRAKEISFLFVPLDPAYKAGLAGHLPVNRPTVNTAGWPMLRMERSLKLKETLNPVTRGFMCVKAQAQPQLICYPARLKYPLKRIRERGSGKWKKVSWGKALDGVAPGLTEIKEEYVPESIAEYVNLNRLAGYLPTPQSEI